MLTTVRKRLELVINEIADAEVIAMLRTAMSELDLVLAQSDAEPVAWRWRYRYSENEEWSEWDMTKRKPATDWKGSPHYQVEPLYTTPPRPDVSAGLIEAACLLDKRADGYTGYNEKIEQGYRMASKYLRARAADRSGK